ncbi:unnamed protein product [Caenorhabditis brenneri]
MDEGGGGGILERITTTASEIQIMRNSNNNDFMGITTTTTNPGIEEVYHIYYLTPTMKALCILFYSILCVLCVYGNVLVILVIVYFKRLRTATNILILNLAVADLLISVFCIPFSYWQVLIFDDQRWLFGSMMCSLLAFLQAMAVFLSAWTLVVISFDRWMAIMFVLTPSIRITNRRALYLVCATWIFSILMALPLLFTTRSFEIQEGLENCGENWTYFGDAGEQVRKVYSSMVVILQYIVPQAVLIITYTHIGIKMWNSRVPGMHNGATKKMIVDRHESVKKLIPMVILISALFALCWLPLLILINVIPEFYPNINSWGYILYLWWFAHGLAMLHSIVNPVIYFLRNARFREGFCYFSSKLLPCVAFKEFRLLTDNTSRRHRLRDIHEVESLTGKHAVRHVSSKPVRSSSSEITLPILSRSSFSRIIKKIDLPCT